MYYGPIKQKETNHFAAPIAEQIWDMKYRFRTDGDLRDLTVEDTWRRVANAVAAAEPEATRADWERIFFDALSNFQFLPAGRILAGAGTGRNVTLFNTFVMQRIPDSMEGIFDTIKEAALTMRMGGGIGYDFSTIRPKGFLVRGLDCGAAGPLAAMDVCDAACGMIVQGYGRGAMMATMRCDHPDIEAFIRAKSDRTKLRNFNLSVLISDAFMQALATDGDWDLVWEGEVVRTIKAADLWGQIMERNYASAEPGVLFIDRINERNPLRYMEEISATNSCAEQPLPPHGACPLGSINLARLVRDAFEPEARLDLSRLGEIVRVAVRLMDNVIDISEFAIEEQRVEARSKRRLGIGVTGVADALIMLGLTYGSEEAANALEGWMREIQHAAYRASVALAREKGAFEHFDGDAYLACPTIQDLDPELRAAIAEHGIRNALLTSIAPTGTISMYAGNVSSGIEPVFATAYTRKVTQTDGSKTTEEVVDYAVHLYREKFGADAELPPVFATAMTLPPMAHVRMQAAAQRWIDSAISKTVNCPADISYEAFEKIYLEAYDSGCKGCTTYRPNAITGSVLTAA